MIHTLKRFQTILYPFFDFMFMGINYLIYILTSRYLSLAQYGQLNAMFSFLAILIVFGMSLQILIAKWVSEEEDIKSILQRTSSLWAQLIIFISIVMLVLHPILINILRSSYLQIIILTVIIMGHISLSFMRGIFQGRKQFFHMSITFGIEVCLKFVIILLILRIWPHVWTVMICVAAGMWVALAYSMRVLYVELYQTDLKENQKPTKYWRDYSKVFFAQFFIFYFTSIDVIVTNFYLPAESGVYAVVSRYGQVMLYVQLSVITVLFPYLNKIKKDKKVFVKATICAGLFFLLFSTIMCAGYFGFVKQTVTPIFGSRYSESAAYLGWIAIAYSFLTLSFYLIHILIILNRTKYIFILFLMSVSLCTGYVLFHSSIISIITIQICIYAMMLILLLSRLILIFKSGGNK
ncbi:MAG: oligosaccharide flippase family protein [Candidatus Margulisbacteria bacterium]|nr:oligosaccharide flippase family protein [Candidatus Margulisiibacteriota bacterium]